MTQAGLSHKAHFFVEMGGSWIRTFVRETGGLFGGTEGFLQKGPLSGKQVGSYITSTFFEEGGSSVRAPVRDTGGPLWKGVVLA